ncbi:MAG: sulfoxide reductase heme-binding subunit YedZ [Acidobacteria bacterium]|nr:sulfoxide reductase heme-binding subunit YedZ [Acidobacteriota bacterium]
MTFASRRRDAGWAPSDRAVRLALKPLVFFAALGPLAWLVWAFLTDRLSVNPLGDLTSETGIWTLRFLCLTLAITPLRRITGWNAIVRFRRMIGLFAFFYGSLHFLTYMLVDRLAGLVEFPGGLVSIETIRRLAASIAGDIAGDRPFITIGFTALALLLPLALTSTTGMIRRLGRKWQALHRLVYVSACLGVVHYWWLVKADISRPRYYALAVGALLGFRAWWSRRRRSRTPARTPAAHPRRMPESQRHTM